MLQALLFYYALPLQLSLSPLHLNIKSILTLDHRAFRPHYELHATHF